VQPVVCSRRTGAGKASLGVAVLRILIAASITAALTACTTMPENKVAPYGVGVKSTTSVKTNSPQKPLEPDE
jgi:hypothetical protein